MNEKNSDSLLDTLLPKEKSARLNESTNALFLTKYSVFLYEVEPYGFVKEKIANNSIVLTLPNNSKVIVDANLVYMLLKQNGYFGRNSSNSNAFNSNEIKVKNNKRDYAKVSRETVKKRT